MNIKRQPIVAAAISKTKTGGNQSKKSKKVVDKATVAKEKKVAKKSSVAKEVKVAKKTTVASKKKVAKEVAIASKAVAAKDAAVEVLSRADEVRLATVSAGNAVRMLHDGFLSEYAPDDGSAIKFTRLLCVRLVFCLYADEAGIAWKKGQFRDYLSMFDTASMRDALIQFFNVVRTPEDKRSRYLRPELAAFPYLSDSLFADFIDIPQITEPLRRMLTDNALDLRWNRLSPPVFAGVLKAVIDMEERLCGDLRMPSLANVHKVLDPLFLDGFYKDFRTAMRANKANRIKRLQAFQSKLASYTFFDPCCGYGYFLIEAYVCVRRIENDVIRAICTIDPSYGANKDIIKVKPEQFYGFEKKRITVTAAKIAFMISEMQLRQDAEEIVGHELNGIGEDDNVSIYCTNALCNSWSRTVPRERKGFVFGKLPRTTGSESQRDELDSKIYGMRDSADLEYAAAWYYNVVRLVDTGQFEAAFVSPNVCGGIRASQMWGMVLRNNFLWINYARRPFVWKEATGEKPAERCVIIGMSREEKEKKEFYFSDSETPVLVDGINPYLFPGNGSVAKSQKVPLCPVPPMTFGNSPRDGGFLLFTDYEFNEAVRESVRVKKWFRPYLSNDGKGRNWCLWLKDMPKEQHGKFKAVRERVEAVKTYRKSSKAKSTRDLARIPSLFGKVTQPEGKDYIALSKELPVNFDYVPFVYMPSTTICSDTILIIPGANYYHLGVLISRLHSAWTHAIIGGRGWNGLYNKEMAYNNFPWPENVPEDVMKRVARTTRAVLKARSRYPRASLNELYDSKLMPEDLLEAHQANDSAVKIAYGLPADATEEQCLARLFELFDEINFRNEQMVVG